MKIFLGTILTSVVFAQGRNLNTVSELQQKWALDENPSSNYTASDNKFVMTYATVADTIVGDANMQVAFYDKNCKNPVAIDGITPTMYPLTEGIGDIDTLKLGDGEGAKIEFVLDPETLANDSKIYSTLNGDGVMKLCVRFSLGYPDDGNFQEVNFVESVISITYDLTAGFDVDGFAVAPKEQDVATGTLTYQVNAYLCVPGSEADGAPYPAVSTAATFNQGDVVEVCVRPDDAARGDGIVMDAITDFKWKRDDVSPSIEQEAIVGSEDATNGLTTYECVSESEYCHFSSILFADFYKSTGNVFGSGNANLKFLLAAAALSELAPSTAPSTAPNPELVTTSFPTSSITSPYSYSGTSEQDDWVFYVDDCGCGMNNECVMDCTFCWYQDPMEVPYPLCSGECSRRLENDANQENDHNDVNSNKNNHNNEIVAGRALQEDNNDVSAAATTATVASSPFDVSVGVTKADDGPGALKTAGGDASSIVGFTALASVVALTVAAALLA